MKDIKHLAAFHARYDTSEKVVMCAWCYRQVPLDQTGMVPTEIDPETGMAQDEEPVCYDCLPEPDEPLVDEHGDDDESSEDRLERQVQAHLESAALHRDDPMF